MNLGRIDSELRQKLLSKEECIGFFVHSSKYYWIISWEAYFNLNHKKNIEAMCEKEQYLRFVPKYLSLEQWRQKQLKEFRDGIPTLTFELFPKYEKGVLAKVVSNELLHDEFFKEDNGQYKNLSTGMEDELSFNNPMDESLVNLRYRLFSKLPKFYVNYDRKIFMHMVRGRSYEAVVLDGWWGAEGDFEHMIPTSHRYWVRSLEEDFWAVTNFSNL